MNTYNHLGILLRNRVNKNQFIDRLLADAFSLSLTGLSFSDMKGVVFSDTSISYFIEKEYRYQTVCVASEENRQLRTFSAGERRKEFLRYCIAQKPDYILLDNPFNHLDQISKDEFIALFEEIAESVLIIQVVNNAEDILHFIRWKVQVQDNSFNFAAITKSCPEPRQKRIAVLPEPYQPFNLQTDMLVEFAGVCVSYEERAIVQDITWAIRRKDFWQLIGPNGSGKSTLLSLITGDNPKAYGQKLYLFGQKKGSGESVWDIKKRIGYFHCAMTELFSRNHSLEQMILSGFFDSIGLYDIPTDRQRKIAGQWLDAVGMSDLRHTPFNALTIGLQRVALIVRAIIKHPPLLILDEPLEGLDDENVMLITQLINAITTKTEITTIYVSHRRDSRISPSSVYELTPSESGSRGRVIFSG